MSFLQEFKKFAIKGNAVDLAVGVVIGAAFTSIVNSLVKDIINPPLSLLTGNINFSEKVIVLKEATESAGSVTLNYGLFIEALINFLIVAFAIFLVVRWINKLRREQPAPETTDRQCPFCKTTIAKAAKRCPNCTSRLT